MKPRGTVYVVDDDPAVRDSLELLIEEQGLAVQTFDSAESFLAASVPAGRGCVIVDLRMPGMDGTQLQEEMAQRGIPLPLIFLTAYGDIPTTVRAVKAGAMDFLTKPVTGTALMESIRTALKESRRLLAQAESSHAASSRLAGLTRREREVMKLVVAGLSNKEIARQLDISHRTVEIHRGRIMQKVGASTLLDLVRVAQEAEVSS